MSPNHNHEEKCTIEQEKCSDAKSRRKAVAEGFQRTDTALLEKCKQQQWQDGATCAAVWISGDSVVVANLGAQSTHGIEQSGFTMPNEK